jgi:hypothetical protein
VSIEYISPKKGTNAQILAVDATDLHAGELLFATDTKHLFAFDGLSVQFTGKVIIDTFANRPSAEVAGRLFYASDTGDLYLDNASTWVSIGGGGTPTYYLCQCYQGSGITRQNLNATSWTPVQWNNETVKDGIYTHSNTTNSSRIEVSTTGLYRVSYAVTTENQNANRKNILSRLRLNGSTMQVPGGVTAYSRNTTDSYATNSCPPVLISMTSGDYIEVVARGVPGASTGNALTVQTDGCWIEMEFIR